MVKHSVSYQRERYSGQAPVTQQTRMVYIYIMGKRYEVPEGLTIMTGLEYCGYRLIRGCGCRLGSCGACVTVYNFRHDQNLRYGLACQTVVEPGMSVMQIPFFPTGQPTYDIDRLEPTSERVLEIFPELATCFGCNNCTRVCPQELEVMNCISAAIKGDFELVTEKSFHCVVCGMCAARCPQGLSPYNIILLCRRLYGRHLVPRSKHLDDRIKEIEAGNFDADYEKMRKLPNSELRRIYEERWIEPK